MGQTVEPVTNFSKDDGRLINKGLPVDITPRFLLSGVFAFLTPNETKQNKRMKKNGHLSLSRSAHCVNRSSLRVFLFSPSLSLSLLPPFWHALQSFGGDSVHLSQSQPQTKLPKVGRTESSLESTRHQRERHPRARRQMVPIGTS